MKMRTASSKNCGLSIVAFALGRSLLANPVMARGSGGGGSIRVGGGGFHHGGGFHGGRGGFHGGGGGWHGGGWRGGGGYGDDYGYGYGGAALGLGLLGGAIIASQSPYYDSGYDSGYDNYPQDGGAGSSGYCASRFKSYDPGSGTYLGYDGSRHPCP